MFKKIYSNIKLFYKSIKINEFIELIIIPLILSIIVIFLTKDIININFIKDFNEDILSIASLLVAFGVSSMTTLFSTSNKNIDLAKNMKTERKGSLNGENISYFQLIQIRCYYSIICELLLIFFTLMSKTIFNTFILSILFYFNIYLLIHTLFIVCVCMMHMYYVSIKQK